MAGAVRASPHTLPSPLLTECSVTAGGFHPGKCYGVYPCPGPKQSSTNTGCQMLNKHVLVLASQAEDMVYSLSELPAGAHSR